MYSELDLCVFELRTTMQSVYLHTIHNTTEEDLISDYQGAGESLGRRFACMALSLVSHIHALIITAHFLQTPKRLLDSIASVSAADAPIPSESVCVWQWVS